MNHGTWSSGNYQINRANFEGRGGFGVKTASLYSSFCPKTHLAGSLRDFDLNFHRRWVVDQACLNRGDDSEVVIVRRGVAGQVEDAPIVPENSAMPVLRHTLISASAGSGKTYQLVQRYLHLLACGVKPSRIAAMTFTRKAAGEFVSRILRSLSELAEDEKLAREFLAGLNPPPEQTVDFAVVLREVLRDLPRLKLGTIDSFFATVAACFPMELGLPVGATIMSEEESRRASTQVIEHLMGRVYREDDRAAARTLLEAFKQATFGHEEKKVLATLADWLLRGHDLWHECEDGTRWGRPDAVWPRNVYPDAAVWRTGKTFHETVDALVNTFSTSGLKDRALEAWEEAQVQALGHRFGRAPLDPLKTIVERLAAVRQDLEAGDGTIDYHRSKWRFHGPAATAALEFLDAMVAQELLTRCRRTQGIRQVIDAYEADYAETVRGRGRLSFADLARLLAKSQGDGSWADVEGTADLWFRMDGRVDHWLFDEFQDTSAQQWGIVHALVGEALQDPEQRRTFFAVGDVKQSIYLWRKAEAQLFGRVLEEYPDRDGRGIFKRSLSKSFRSCQQVLDLVNAVFGRRATLSQLLGDGCLKHWEFELHESAKPDLKGLGALVQPAEAIEGVEQPDAWDLTAALLRQIQPAKRGLSCAVLVRSNSSAAQLTEFLREQTGQDVTSQSEEFPAADNTACSALLAVLQLTAHPGDTQALEHLRMTPLAPIFNEDGWRSRINETLLCLHDDGFAAAIELWTARFGVVLDAFSQRRVDRLIEIAAEFDESGSRDVDEFLPFARSYGVRSGGAHLAVQVMTVHKSKGLEFDVVLMPLLDNAGLKNVEPGMVLKREGLGEAEWVLQFPPQPFDRLDEVLAAQLQAMEEDAGFESLCRHYVAMTRAKRALYVVAPRPPKGSKTINAQRLMRETLSQGEPVDGLVDGVDVEWLRVFGRTDWFESVHVAQAPEDTESEGESAAKLVELLRAHQPMAKRSTPSGEESFEVKGSVLFSPGRETGRNLGTLVHMLMEQVGWIDEHFSEAALAVAWKAKGLSDLPAFAEAEAMALRVVRSRACREAFTCPGPHFKLWRERPFDLILDDGAWISGTVDRVNVTCDPQGRAIAATIIDFKTDDVPDAEKLAAKLAGYRPQLALYRKAVAKLTGLREADVGAKLLFTRTGEVAEI